MRFSLDTFDFIRHSPLSDLISRLDKSDLQGSCNGHRPATHLHGKAVVRKRAKRSWQSSVDGCESCSISLRRQSSAQSLMQGAARTTTMWRAGRSLARMQ
eukprot:6195865-Pleurochrysis_carterae.AAC.4